MLSDWRAKAGLRKRQRERIFHEARSNTRAVQTLVHPLYDGQKTHPSPRHQTKERGSIEKTRSCDGVPLNEHEFGGECPNNIRGTSNKHSGERRQASQNQSSVALKRGVGEPVTIEGVVRLTDLPGLPRLVDSDPCFQKPCSRKDVKQKSQQRMQWKETSHRTGSSRTQ